MEMKCELQFGQRPRENYGNSDHFPKVIHETDQLTALSRGLREALQVAAVRGAHQEGRGVLPGEVQLLRAVRTLKGGKL